MKKVVFLTGTRADYGKLKSILSKLLEYPDKFEVNLFATGMHMLAKYGSTYQQLTSDHLYHKKYLFINQNYQDTMDAVLSKTVTGFSDFVKEYQPDLIIVHGDRVEALAGSIVGCLNNIPVAHIEGGELSGTIDEVLRHAISKLSLYHFVSNESSRRRLIQMGEKSELIHVVGSPDLDIMSSNSLPSMEEVAEHYNIVYDKYAIVILHPVTTESEQSHQQAVSLMNALNKSGYNYVGIYPNNDCGSEFIFQEIKRYEDNTNFKFFPSMRFEHFLTLLKNASFVVGNSSAGIREAPFFGIPAINIGTRQNNRSDNPVILNTSFNELEILAAVDKALSGQLSSKPSYEFGDGKSAERVLSILAEDSFWRVDIQKAFVDLDNT